MLRRVKADLHVHTCLSPCGDLEMSPRKIAARARETGIDLIGICDHNSAENVTAVIGAAAKTEVTVIPGLEVCTREEIHVLALFQTVEAAAAMQNVVYHHLQGVNNPDLFGIQVIANASDEVMGFEDKLLIGATTLTVERTVNEIHRLGGLAIAAHIDRENYSVISQLGFIPESLTFDARELTHYTGPAEARTRFGLSTASPFVRNSDAHFLNDVGSNTSEYLVEEASFAEIRKALRGEAGRMICEDQ